MIHPTHIKGTVTLSDGSTTEFHILPEYGWSQWGNITDKLGETVDLMEALTEAALDAGLAEGEDA